MISEKLKAARAEMLAIAKKYDIACAVVLHDKEVFQGHPHGIAEFFWDIQPTWSAVEETETAAGTMVLIRGKLAHYAGDKRARNRALRNTINMLSLLGTTMANVAMRMLDLAEKADKTWDATHTDGGYTPHAESQN